MLSTLLAIAPIFALVFAGWGLRRVGVFGPNASTELTRFVVYLGLPALLFDIVAHARWAEVWQPGFILAFGVGAAAVFALTVAVRLRRPRHLADAAIDGLSAGYANVAFMGFPLTLAVMGPGAAAPVTIATIVTVCVLFAVAIVLIEAGLQTERRGGARIAAKVAGALARNPLVIAPVLGAVAALAGLAIPAPVEGALKMLGGAASPCALVSIGLFLGAPRAPRGREAGERGFASTATLVGFKLILQPLVTFVLARAFGLPPFLSHAAVLLAALPTGTGPFMLAEYYRREAGVTSDAILVSTVGSVATVSAYLAFVR